MGVKIVTVVGARPQFIKAAAVSRVIRDMHASQVEEVLLHTGQHYDDNMSRVFFEELDIPHPKYNLQISGGPHGAMTGRMMESIEKILIDEKPDWVLIYGDTNSTLAAALAAAKLHIRVAHVEAGLRSFNMRMPEEINRILSDRVSTLLFCPTATAVKNLKDEGIEAGVQNVGDVMYDAALFYGARAEERSNVLSRFGLQQSGYALATCHRAENTDSPSRLREICIGLSNVGDALPVIFPIHPRTRKLIDECGFRPILGRVRLIEPVAFIDMIALERSAKVILTDSGGVQKEAYFYRVPCVTMRDETEWMETVASGWNTLVGANAQRIANAMSTETVRQDIPGLFGDGQSASRIVSALRE